MPKRVLRRILRPSGRPSMWCHFLGRPQTDPLSNTHAHTRARAPGQRLRARERCLYIYIYTHTHTHTYTYTYTYTYTHTHTHIHILSSSRKPSGRFYGFRRRQHPTFFYNGFRRWFFNILRRRRKRLFMVSVIGFLMVSVVAGKHMFMVSVAECWWILPPQEDPKF